MSRSRAKPSEPDQVTPTWAELVWDRLTQTYRLTYRLVDDYHDTEDLTQDIFVRVFKSIHSFQPGTLEGWLHHVTTNLFLDSAQRRQRIRMDALSLTPEHVQGQDRSPEELHTDGALDADVVNALAALGPEQRVAVMLCNIEEMSYEEISEVLGIKLGTVCSRIARGRAQLHDVPAHRAPDEDHTRYLGVPQEVWGNDYRRYEDDPPGLVDQTLPKRHVSQVSECLMRCPECSAVVDEPRRVRSRLSFCQTAATLSETLARRPQGITGGECGQLLYLTGDGPRRHSHGGHLTRGGMTTTAALATLTILSLAPVEEPAVVDDPARAARERYSLALTIISIGQGVGAAQWTRERGARSGVAMRLSSRTLDLGQAVPIDENNAMIRLGNNGQSVTCSGRQQV